jgi:hypothetical protein
MPPHLEEESRRLSIIIVNILQFLLIFEEVKEIQLFQLGKKWSTCSTERRRAFLE